MHADKAHGTHGKLRSPTDGITSGRTMNFPDDPEDLDTAIFKSA
jgi:hypothetical protein